HLDDRLERQQQECRLSETVAPYFSGLTALEEASLPAALLSGASFPRLHSLSVRLYLQAWNGIVFSSAPLTKLSVLNITPSLWRALPSTLRTLTLSSCATGVSHKDDHS